MFLATDGFAIVTVYAVRESDGVIEFLLYDTEGWGWSEARHYEPYNPSDDEVSENENWGENGGYKAQNAALKNSFGIVADEDKNNR